jgi:hypothetical protein
VNIELRDDEVIITRPKIEGSYTEYCLQTRSPKIKKTVDVKKIIIKED